jgi:protein involved in polysaccharide export with SLBB domain
MSERLGSLALLLCGVVVAASCGHAPRQPANGAASSETLVSFDERLGVDDVFDVRIVGEPDLSNQYRVSADGTIDFPYVGRLEVLGLRPGEVQKELTTRLKAGYIRDPQIVVLIKEWNSRKINVLGQVSKPGPVVYFPRMTIVDAISAAGGFTAIAAKNTVYLRRDLKNGRVETKSYRVADISEGRAPNVMILPGDVLVVEERLF